MCVAICDLSLSLSLSSSGIPVSDILQNKQVSLIFALLTIIIFFIIRLLI